MKNFTLKTQLQKLQAKVRNLSFAMLKQLTQNFFNFINELVGSFSVSQMSMFAEQLKLNSSTLRIGVLAFLLIGIPGILATPEQCYAQTGVSGSTGSTNGSSPSLEAIANNAFSTIYNTWRWPVCALLMLGAGLVFLVGGDRGKTVALGICVGVLLFAMVPYFVDTFKSWAGQGKTSTGQTTGG